MDHSNKICISLDCNNKPVWAKGKNRPNSRCASCQSNLNRYGVTTPERNELLNEQGGICPICLEAMAFSGPGRGRGAACVDHDHSNKEPHVRGIICHACNIGLGKFHDEPETLQRAIYYLLNSDQGGQ